jgi:hypothetical protein
MSDVKNPILGYADSYRQMARVAKAEGRHQMIDMFSVVTDLERNIAPLFTAAQSELSALREELAIKTEAYQGAHMMCTDLKDSLTAAEQRNATLIASIVALPDEFKELSGCENTAGVYACIDYISDWVAELTKPTESGAS